MSSKPSKARKASKPEVNALSPLDSQTEDYDRETPLTKGEISRLNMLGYKNADIDVLYLDEARQRLARKEANPGSSAYLKQQINPLTGVKGSSPIEGHYDNETIEARNTGKEANSYIITDEWQNKGRDAGGMLFDQLDKPYRDANPDYVFRWLSPEVVKLLGDDGFQAMPGKDGGKVMCADSWLAFKPRSVQEEETARLRETINAPFEDMGRPQTVELSSVRSAPRPVQTVESTIRRGEETPHYTQIG